jgi:ankyrin repeat protein
VIAFSHDVGLLKCMINLGADVNIKANNGSTCLHSASKEDCIDILEALIQAGADLEAQDLDGDTALNHAASTGNFEAIKLLMKVTNGTLLNKRNNFGTNALMYACSVEKSLEICKYLVKKGVDIKAVDKEGKNCIYYAGN